MREVEREWRHMVVGLEVCGRGGGVWERWRCVREVEVCGRGGGVWERWRCVRELVCDRSEVWWEEWCVGGVEVWRGGDVWEGVCVEGWRCVKECV